MTQPSLIIKEKAYQAGGLLGYRPSLANSGAVIPIEMPLVRAGGRTRINKQGLVEPIANNVPALTYINGYGQYELLPAYTNDWTNNNELTGYISSTNAVRGNLVNNAFGSGFNGVEYTFIDGQTLQGAYAVRALTNTTGLPIQRAAILIKNPSHDFISVGITGFSTVRFQFSSLQSSSNEGRMFKIAENTYVVYLYNDLATTITLAQMRISTVTSLASGITVSGTAIIGLGFFRAQASGFLPNIYAPVITAGSGVTTVTDNSVTTGLAENIGQTEGSIFIDFVYRNTLGSRGQLGVLKSGSTTNRIVLWNDASNRFSFQLAASGVNDSGRGGYC